MKDFYLNKQFFEFYLGCYYPLGDDFFIHVKHCSTIPDGYKKVYGFDVDFCVKVDDEFIPVFTGSVNLSSRRLSLVNLKYILDSDCARAINTYFPLSPAWQLPCTRVSVWLRRCYISLNVYRSSDWI